MALISRRHGRMGASDYRKCRYRSHDSGLHGSIIGLPGSALVVLGRHLQPLSRRHFCRPLGHLLYITFGNHKYRQEMEVATCHGGSDRITHRSFHELLGARPDGRDSWLDCCDY